ncbi:MAG: UDP-2,3-diacylglucosamine diphosphatase LpxI [Kiritimatiellaeota bacterium]|nr:UDP-2,3-diacylglucosamine diphosphatase LpxI [Kiritimatiellota bacterium]
METLPKHFLILAGRGTYPLVMARGARRAGVETLSILAIRGAADRAVKGLADAVHWIGVGEMERGLAWALERGATHMAMAGGVSPLALFTTRFDTLSKKLLLAMPVKNAHTIFGGLAEAVEANGIRVLPASVFMDDALPEPGLLTRRAPTPQEDSDIALGLGAAMVMGNLDIGQTLVAHRGMITAVEAFEGTNAAIRRAGKLTRGGVVVKVAKDGHDMRFDIPAIGPGTLSAIRRAGVTALAFQARRTILLDRDETVRLADKAGIAVVAVDSGLPPAETRPGVGH